MKKMVSIILGIAMLFALAACGAQESSKPEADPGTQKVEEEKVEEVKAYKVGFADSFNGSTFRQIEEEAVEKVCEEMKAAGRISEYAITCANNDLTTQINHINSFILDDYDIIIIDPASSSGLNDVIKKATDAGIIVFAVSTGPLDTPGLCYEMNTLPTQMWHDLTVELAALVNNEGNVLVSRGVIGNAFDKNANDGVTAALESLPNMTKVGEVESQWADAVAKEAFAQVLPSLDYDVDLVIGQGGDDKVVVDLFEAAGKEVPVIMGQGRGNFLKWWAHEYEENGYTTVSGMADPWCAAMAVYTALDIADGKVSFSGENMSMDCGGLFLRTEDIAADLEYFKNMSDEDVYCFERDYEYTVKMYTPYAD